MHAQIVQVAAHRAVIGLGREPCQAFFVYEAAERIDAGHEHVYSQVKFETVYEVGFVQVFLGNIVLSLYQPVAVSRQENASSLAVLFGLHDEGFGSLAVELLFETFGVCGQDPSLREEVVIVRQYCLHVC